MNAGDIVRPNAEAISLTRFTEASRLTVKGVQRAQHCRACKERAKLERPNAGPVVWWKASLIPRGALYAAGSEPSSNLCLAHCKEVAT